MEAQGPLAGIRILEIESIGPGPHAAMLLAGLGASVLRITRPGPAGLWTRNPVLNRGRAGEIALDFKQPDGRERVLKLVKQTDALIEGFRPQVMERLGLGPEECLARRPQLVYGRITGWGRNGPLSPRAGHDINYIALTGALHAIGTRESGPVPPLNLVGDFGGGGMLLAFGVVSALLESQRSGRGQVVDANMLDGVANLMAMTYGLLAHGHWRDQRACNFLDGGAWFYTCYRCRDGGFVAVGAIETRFRECLLGGLGFAPPHDRFLRAAHDDPATRAEIAARFAQRDRDEWVAIFEGSDACVSPVLSIKEAPMHPHIHALGTLRTVGGAVQPMPAPRFSVTPASPDGNGGATLDGWALDGFEVQPADRSG